MAGIVDNSGVEDGQDCNVRVGCVGFDEKESSWEPLATIWDGAPMYLQIPNEVANALMTPAVRFGLKDFSGS